jgi:hypothetical protein
MIGLNSPAACGVYDEEGEREKSAVRIQKSEDSQVTLSRRAVNIEIIGVF